MKNEGKLGFLIVGSKNQYPDRRVASIYATNHGRAEGTKRRQVSSRDVISRWRSRLSMQVRDVSARGPYSRSDLPHSGQPRALNGRLDSDRKRLAISGIRTAVAVSIQGPISL
jgi:hypothetical protein